MYLNKEPLRGNFKSKFILIKDSTVACGLKLFKTISKVFHKEEANLHFMYYESLTRDIEHGFNPQRVTSTNAVADPCGWDDSIGWANFRSAEIFEKKISEFKGVVCIDSLSPLLFYNDAVSFYRTLHKILKHNADIHFISVLHADVHDSYEIEILEKLSTTVLFTTAYDDKVLTTIRYPSGKVTNQLVEYKISDDFEFSILRDVNLFVKSVPSKQPDPTANLTFNLKLKDTEKEARSQLKLPYMQMQNEDPIKMDDDMYEEDDPDDDLDI